MRLTLTALALLISAMLFAQAPALIPYQAIARNAAGEPIANSTLNARFTIHDATATGTSVWQEMQTVSTSALGLFTSQLGSSISLAGLNWANGAKFIQVELDLGSGFIDIGTQQLLSVPYALHAGSVHLDVSATGDTLFVGDGRFVIIPGISEANNGSVGANTGITLHTSGAVDVHNPNLTYGNMCDQDGNIYKTIVIGTQEWMAENLKATHYRNGELIPVVTINNTWGNLTTGSTCWYNNDSAGYNCPYGMLYNWYAASDFRNLCPTGWHVPSDSEWNTLIGYLDPSFNPMAFGIQSSLAGVKMKSIGTLHWNSPNVPSDNSSGFSGLPGGYRVNFGQFNLGNDGAWWSSSERDTNAAWIRDLGFDDGRVDRYVNFKTYGYSVRCLKD